MYSQDDSDGTHYQCLLVRVALPLFIDITVFIALCPPHLLRASL